ncbi:MAG: hypothetical protein WAK01_04420 [Methylocystis sp.]
MEAPDTEKKSDILPVHLGVVAHLGNGEKSFFNEFQNYLYPAGLALASLRNIIASPGFITAAELLPVGDK